MKKLFKKYPCGETPFSLICSVSILTFTLSFIVFSGLLCAKNNSFTNWWENNSDQFIEQGFDFYPGDNYTKKGVIKIAGHKYDIDYVVEDDIIKVHFYNLSFWQRMIMDISFRDNIQKKEGKGYVDFIFNKNQLKNRLNEMNTMLISLNQQQNFNTIVNLSLRESNSQDWNSYLLKNKKPYYYSDKNGLYLYQDTSPLQISSYDLGKGLNITFSFKHISSKSCSSLINKQYHILTSYDHLKKECLVQEQLHS